MTIFQAQQFLSNNLKTIYNKNESAIITDWLLEELVRMKKSERLIYRENLLSDNQENLLRTYVNELLKHRPIQYILGFSHFMKMKFYVNEYVLIPRPETEELVEWIIQSFDKNCSYNILDIGTGSGIIPISLKKYFSKASVSAIDISGDALNIAKKNAEINNQEIQYYELDILNEDAWKMMGSFDIIVSNPPYVRQTEKEQMDKNVLNYEPHLALFVEDENPLLFYKKIINFSKQHLNNGGYLFFEINESFGKEVVNLFAENYFQNIELKKDFMEKDRMVKSLFKK